MDDATDTGGDGWYADHEGYVDWLEEGRVGVVFASPDGEMLMEIGLEVFPSGQRGDVHPGAWATVTIDPVTGAGVALAERGRWTKEEIDAARARADRLRDLLFREEASDQSGSA